MWIHMNPLFTCAHIYSDNTLCIYCSQLLGIRRTCGAIKILIIKCGIPSMSKILSLFSNSYLSLSGKDVFNAETLHWVSYPLCPLAIFKPLVFPGARVRKMQL